MSFCAKQLFLNEQSAKYAVALGKSVLSCKPTTLGEQATKSMSSPQEEPSFRANQLFLGERGAIFRAERLPEGMARKRHRQDHTMNNATW